MWTKCGLLWTICGPKLDLKFDRKPKSLNPKQGPDGRRTRRDTARGVEVEARDELLLLLRAGDELAHAVLGLKVALRAVHKDNRSTINVALEILRYARRDGRS